MMCGDGYKKIMESIATVPPLKIRKRANDFRVRRREEIIGIRAEVNAIENQKSVEKVNEIKSWFFKKKSDKINTKKREEGHIENMENERGDIITDPMNIKRLIKQYYKQLNLQIWSFS